MSEFYTNFRIGAAGLVMAAAFLSGACDKKRPTAARSQDSLESRTTGQGLTNETQHGQYSQSSKEEYPISDPRILDTCHDGEAVLLEMTDKKQTKDNLRLDLDAFSLYVHNTSTELYLSEEIVTTTQGNKAHLLTSKKPAKMINPLNNRFIASAEFPYLDMIYFNYEICNGEAMLAGINKEYLVVID